MCMNMSHEGTRHKKGPTRQIKGPTRRQNKGQQEGANKTQQDRTRGQQKGVGRTLDRLKGEGHEKGGESRKYRNHR